jgi:ATP-dependent Lhr-like helicase
VTGFDKLHPLVQYHITNTLGWRSLRRLQEESIEPIQQGDHCLLIAPTAGGKTEAAIFPVLSRLCFENWSGVTVLYICPLRALLNNLYVRLEGYCQMVGRRCGLWHGDIAESAKNNIRAENPDILLTTPESLEVMLISTRSSAREMLKSIRIVVIDEIHSFAGDDRGCHLLSVLERITRLAGRELQRIGLSATVGNPEELLEWMAGYCEGSRRVLNPPAQIASNPDVQIDYVGTLENAAIVISRLHRGEKRLVFCDSRSRVEELGNELRRLGVSTFLSHSSLSADERRDAEQAFAEAQDCVIIATSTLELGIDVGDLDHVIQIDAPFSVASFLQRLGRTGRRSGALRNCLFLTTNEHGLLRAAAIVGLWEMGFVEPIIPPSRPLHLFAQQIMAIVLQQHGIAIHEWHDWIGRLPAFAELPEPELDAVVKYLLDRAILFFDGARLGFGAEGESLFGRRNFLELVSVFTSPPLFKVLHGRKELGTVHQVAFLRSGEHEVTVLSLGGRSWAVSSLDWSKREAYVVPSDEKGKTRWLSGQMGLRFNVSRAIRDVLASQSSSRHWSSRAQTKLNELREQYAFLEGAEDVIASGSGETRWYTFAGNIINSALSDVLKANGYGDVRADDFSVRIKGLNDHRRLETVISDLDLNAIKKCFQIDAEYLSQLKFSECLPKPLAEAMMKDRLLSAECVDSIVQAKRRFVSLENP